MPVTPELGRQMQEDQKFKAIFDHFEAITGYMNPPSKSIIKQDKVNLYINVVF